MPRLVRSRQISMGLERSQVEMKDESSNSDCFGSKPPAFASSPELLRCSAKNKSRILESKWVSLFCLAN